LSIYEFIFYLREITSMLLVLYEFQFVIKVFHLYKLIQNKIN